MAKSLALPRDEDKMSQGSSIKLGAIKLDFRKSSSGGRLVQMLRGSGGNPNNNQIASEVRGSREAGFSAARNSKGGGQVGARYSSIEMANQQSVEKTVGPRGML